MALQVTRLDHVAIATADTPRMVAWYQRVLGMKVAIEAGPNPPQTQKVYLIGPAEDGFSAGMMLEVMQKNDTPRHQRNSHEPGLSHIAFAVADFDGALAHLKQMGVVFLGDIVTAVGGGRLISFADLEGNMLQIVERR